MDTAIPPAFPARIHVLLASQAPVGLIIRRGPSKHTATVLWDRRRNTFEMGQWLKGRIYERRSDLSPDGKYFIYLAMNGKSDSEAKGAWTAPRPAPRGVQARGAGGGLMQVLLNKGLISRIFPSSGPGGGVGSLPRYFVLRI